MDPNGEPQPGATPPEASSDAAAAQQVRDELTGVTTVHPTEAPSPEPNINPELIEAREKALRYAERRMDLMGVDGKPLSTDVALQLIKGVHTEGLHILIDQLDKKAKGEPTDEVVIEQGLTLSFISSDAAYRIAEQQVKQNSQAEMMKLLNEAHTRNPLTKTDFFESLFKKWPTEKKSTDTNPLTPSSPTTNPLNDGQES